MSEPDAPSEALAREAAHWFARMRAPDAETDREELEAWLARGPKHRRAFNRAAEIFAMGKLLIDEPAPLAQRRRRPLVVALAVAIVCVLGASGWAVMRLSGPDRPSRAIAGDPREVRELATIAGETRAVRLADGSRVTLTGDSELLLRLDSGRRLLRLTRGKARFEVAHEARPFVVLAGSGSVTARGTVFEVALAPDARVAVRLFEGAVDVALPGRQGGDRQPVVRRLRPGESVSFAARTEMPAATPLADGRTASGSVAGAAHDYAGATVTELVAEANRVSPRPIRLASASLGAERVSGRFRTDDTALLAMRLAALLDGEADTRDAHEILLTR